ncbi:MAG: alpha/beta hydrolase [Deltaproteobacteria bacterium]
MKSVRANGVELAYLEQGTGPLVVLIHGFPDTAQTWDATMAALAEAGYRAVAPFLRGYHPSEIPANGVYDMETLGRDVLALIEALGAQNAIVVGHDWGATAAYTATAQDPYRVRLLVTVAIPHPRSIKPTPRAMWKMRHFLALRGKGAAAKTRADDFAYVDELWRRWSPAWEPIPASETAAAKDAFSQPGVCEAACAYYASLPLFTTPKSLRGNITVPTVSFAGEHDGIMKPRAFEKARHCFDASYEVIQVPGGHFMHREHPEVFIPELVKALQQHEQRVRQ